MSVFAMVPHPCGPEFMPHVSQQFSCLTDLSVQFAASADIQCVNCKQHRLEGEGAEDGEREVRER